MNGYIAFYNQKTHEVYAGSSYEAQQKAMEFFKPPKSKQHMVSVVLAEKEGKGVVHTPTF